MKMKKTFFNKKIFMKNLTSALPLILIMSAIMALLSTSWLHRGVEAVTLGYTDFGSYYADPDNAPYLYVVSQWLLATDTVFVKLLLTAYSFICGIFAFRFLYSRRLSATIHALPVTRTGMYISNLLSGLAITAAPLCLTTIICSIYLLAHGYGIGYAGLWFVMMLGYCLIFYALSVLTVMLTGHLIAAPALYLFLNSFILAAQTIVQWIVSAFCYGNYGYGMDNNVSAIHTPFLYLWEESNTCISPDDMKIYYAEDGWHALIIYAVISIVLFVISGVLYSRRRLETQGDPIVTKKLQPFFHGYTTAVISFGLMLIIYYYWVDSGYSEYAYMDATRHMIWMLVIFLIVSVVCYTVLAMLLKKSLHVLKSVIKGFSVYGVICILLALGIHFYYVPAIENRIPDQGDIAYLSVNNGNFPSSFYIPANSLQDVKSCLDIHKAILEHKSEFISYDKERRQREKENRYDEDYRMFYITYYLTNGKTIYRSYTIPLEDSGADVTKLIDDTFKDSDMMARIFADSKANLDSVIIEYDNRSPCYELSYISDTPFHAINRKSERDKPLLDAIQKDIEEGNMPYEDYAISEEEDTSNDVMYYINVNASFITDTKDNKIVHYYDGEYYNYYYGSLYNDYNNYYNVNLFYKVTKDCTHTLDVLDQYAKKGWVHKRDKEYDYYDDTIEYYDENIPYENPVDPAIYY